MKQGIGVTHRLTSKGQVQSTGAQQSTTATHILKSKAQVSSVDLTNIALYSSHSPTGEPRTGIVSKLNTHQDTIATHRLKN